MRLEIVGSLALCFVLIWLDWDFSGRNWLGFVLNWYSLIGCRHFFVRVRHLHLGRLNRRLCLGNLLIDFCGRDWGHVDILGAFVELEAFGGLFRCYSTLHKLAEAAFFVRNFCLLGLVGLTYLRTGLFRFGVLVSVCAVAISLVLLWRLFAFLLGRGFRRRRVVLIVGRDCARC